MTAAARTMVHSARLQLSCTQGGLPGGGGGGGGRGWAVLSGAPVSLVYLPRN